MLWKNSRPSLVSRSPRTASRSPWPRSFWLVAVVGAAAVAALVPLVTLLVSDDAASNLVEETLPLVRSLVHLTTLAAVACLSLATFLPLRSDAAEALTTTARRFSFHGSIAGLAAVLACALLLLWTYFNVLGEGPLEGAGFGDLGEFLNQLASGRALMAQMGLLLAGAVFAFLARTILPLRMALFLTVAAATTMALGGHSASEGGHDVAMFSMAAHIAAASLWVGGLAGLGLLARGSPELLGPAVARFSRLALICAVVVGVSGAANALVRVEDLAALPGSLYGLILLLKVVAFTALIIFGALHRRRLLRLENFTSNPFLQLTAGELVVMGAAYGLATALVSLDPPTTSALASALVS